MLEYPKFLAYFICVLYIKIHSSFECWHYYDDIIQSTNFDIATFRFRNFSMFFYGIGIGFEKNWYRKSIGIGFENFWYRKKVSVLVSKKFGIEKSIGIGIGKILVSKKVSVLVSKKIGIGKKYRYRYRKKLVSEKSIGIGIVQILGFVTHCNHNHRQIKVIVEEGLQILKSGDWVPFPGHLRVDVEVQR